MENKFFQLSKLKQVTDKETKQKKFTGEISIIYVRASFIEIVGTDSVNNRTISWIVCSDGSHFPIDIHPSDLIGAMRAELLTTAEVMKAAQDLMPDQSFNK